MWTFPSFESIRQDVRYAIRTLRRAPAFTSVALLALTLGIAGNTAIFSLVDAVRIRALPYAEPEQLVVLWGNVMRATLERRGASYPDFLDWRAQARLVRGDGGAGRDDDDAVGRGRGQTHSRRNRVGGILSAAPRQRGARADLHGRRGRDAAEVSGGGPVRRVLEAGVRRRSADRRPRGAVRTPSRSRLRA